MYMGFLMSEPKSTTCTRLSQVMGISHDSVNRFLLRESYEPRDLFNQAKQLLNVVGGTLNVDDSTLDKPYSQKMALVAHFWSGKHHRGGQGAQPGHALYYTDLQGRSLPVNYRVYDKADNKSKNDYFQGHAGSSAGMGTATGVHDGRHLGIPARKTSRRSKTTRWG